MANKERKVMRVTRSLALRMTDIAGQSQELGLCMF